MMSAEKVYVNKKEETPEEEVVIDDDEIPAPPPLDNTAPPGLVFTDGTSRHQGILESLRT